MFRNIINLKYVIILTLLVSIAGCNNKEDVESLKKELAETQGKLKDCQRSYEAVCLDLRNVKANRRSLDTRLGDVNSTAKTTEEQLYLTQQIILELQLEIENRDATIQEMQLIINDQETALQEFLDVLGQPATEQINY